MQEEKSARDMHRLMIKMYSFRGYFWSSSVIFERLNFKYQRSGLMPSKRIVLNRYSEQTTMLTIFAKVTK